MRTYRGKQTETAAGCEFDLDMERNWRPLGFDPNAPLAFALLTYCVGSETAVLYSEEFQETVLHKLGRGRWMLSESVITKWLADHHPEAIAALVDELDGAIQAAKASIAAIDRSPRVAAVISRDDQIHAFLRDNPDKIAEVAARVGASEDDLRTAYQL